jgi:hypothetical protein
MMAAVSMIVGVVTSAKMATIKPMMLVAELMHQIVRSAM